MSYCSDLSGFNFLYQSQLLKYKTAWDTFNRVQAYNSNISTLRAGGQTDLSYYQFLTNQEKNAFNVGRLLHFQSFPNNNWPLVQEN
jgi:hypothetical protein